MTPEQEKDMCERIRHIDQKTNEIHQWIFAEFIGGQKPRNVQLDQLLVERRFKATLTKIFGWTITIASSIFGLWLAIDKVIKEWFH